ncbi:hypothetical protein EYF80_004052 [Liparis tanakae]|uniref:Uncharacterized protein n=1 Tax=Liparis tanakae TaxID=230148 RepID=A0A4Z2J5Z5_9TELE|nr:hypothetical protein EYF80_004052 [Liparis tanakae]
MVRCVTERVRESSDAEELLGAKRKRERARRGNALTLQCPPMVALYPGMTWQHLVMIPKAKFYQLSP